MHYINGSNAIEHQDADCNCVSCKSLFSTDRAAVNARSNVIAFVQASKPAPAIDTVKFNYPMLECS